MGIASVNPATGETLERFESLEPTAVEERLVLAARASATWRMTDLRQRVAVLLRAAELLQEERTRYGRMMTLEMGKPIRAALAEVDKCATVCRYYAEHAAAFLAPELVDGKDHTVRYQPLGVVLAVMPWNFPFWQVIRFAAPALVAGNVALLKHASNVPRCALALEALFRDAGAPAGVFQSLLIGSDAVEGLIADPRIAAVTLTGSEAAGQAIGAAAGRHLKKSVLELGGSDPFIVLPSADLQEAVTVAVKARTINNGQSCIAAKRFIVADAVYEKFRDGFVERLRGVRVGDPIEETTELGPLATPAILEALEDQVRRSIAAGARCLLGGARRPGPGNYFEPTVLADIAPSAPAYHEELFGPVASLFRVRNVDEALQVANATRYGLGASVWTKDRDEAALFVEGLDSGTVFVNGMVASDPRFPFGGIKRSGYGRELGPWGLREFVNVKTARVFL